MVCLFCATGIDEGQGVPLARLTVSNVWAMDAALAAQLTMAEFQAGRG